MEIVDALRAYRDAGLAVMPAVLERKCPGITGPMKWEQFKRRLPTDEEIEQWTRRRPKAICIACGEASGGLEMIDFDHQAIKFDAWASVIKRRNAELFDRLVIEQSQSGGKHAFYRSPACDTNLKLAIPKEGGKAWIETRGHGGQFLCAPSPGYRLLQGSLSAIPTIAPEERSVLIYAGLSFNRYRPPPVLAPKSCERSHGVTNEKGRVGDIYDQVGDVRGLLATHGWKPCYKSGNREYWTRPGKPHGVSASWNGKVFYVFSSSVNVLESGKAYMPFTVYTALTQGGLTRKHFTDAARVLRKEMGNGVHSENGRRGNQ